MYEQNKTISNEINPNYDADTHKETNEDLHGNGIQPLIVNEYHMLLTMKGKFKHDCI